MIHNLFIKSAHFYKDNYEFKNKLTIIEHVVLQHPVTDIYGHNFIGSFYLIYLFYLIKISPFLSTPCISSSKYGISVNHLELFKNEKQHHHNPNMRVRRMLEKIN